MRLSLPVLSIFTLSAAAILLSGCSSSFDPMEGVSPESSSVGAITGAVHGGRQPISGAHIYLLQASTGAYAGIGIEPLAYTASPTNASTSLLKAFTTGSYPTAQDGNGNYYVTTSANGAFSITGEYTSCTVGDEVYLYSIGGNPGGTSSNSAAGLMAILGTCPSGGSLASAYPSVNMNEVSTVAAAYAMAGFATDATHVGTSGSTLAKAGIANAFANAAQLYDITTNPYTSPNTEARTTTPAANGGNGTVPQTKIDSLANSLSACINSSGSTSTACSTLFSNTVNTTVSPTITPTDTATAAINLAHSPEPSAAAVSAIFGNTVGIGTPYPDKLGSAPADWTIAITFTGGGLTRNSGSDSGIGGTVAIDSSGNVWSVNRSTSSVSKFSPTGEAISGSGGFTGSGLSEPNGLAIDTSVPNRVWAINYNENSGDQSSVSVLNNDGSAYADYTSSTGCYADGGAVAFDNAGSPWFSSYGGTYVCKGASNGTNPTVENTSLAAPPALASDAAGNIWVANSQVNQVNKFSGSTNIDGSPFSGSSIGTTWGVAVDSNNDAWISSDSPADIVEITGANPGVVSATTGGGMTEPSGIAVDGADYVWMADYGTGSGDGDIVELNSRGTLISGPFGYQSGTGYDGQGIAIDGSGDVWFDNLNANTLRELIGAATPVVTPLSAATAGNKLGARP